jgi:ribokinase
MKFDIVTFGSAVIDTFVSTELAEKNNFFNYPLGDKILVKDLHFDIGGGGTNTAVAFSRLGLKTGCITKIGADHNGKLIKEGLAKEKVSLLCPKLEGKSGYSIILDSTKSDRTILTFKGTNDNISSKDISKFDSKWLYLSSVLGESLKTQINLATKLSKSGTKIAFNPSSYLIKDADISPLIKVCDILILNKSEAKLLCKKYLNSDSPDSIKSIGPKTIIITDAENSVICYADGKKIEVKPKKVNAVELTGAGDAFASGFVAGQILGWSIKDSLDLAFKESAGVISEIGAKKGLLHLKLQAR